MTTRAASAIAADGAVPPPPPPTPTTRPRRCQRRRVASAVAIAFASSSSSSSSSAATMTAEAFAPPPRSTATVSGRRNRGGSLELFGDGAGYSTRRSSFSSSRRLVVGGSGHATLARPGRSSTTALRFFGGGNKKEEEESDAEKRDNDEASVDADDESSASSSGKIPNPLLYLQTSFSNAFDKKNEDDAEAASGDATDGSGNNDEDESNESSSSPSSGGKILFPLLYLKSSLSNAFPEAFENTSSFLKVALPSFLAGGSVTVALLLAPLYSDLVNPSSPTNKLNEPVLLFETILSDLDSSYVDTVDVKQLFETGVRAMTSSLDPYTEFESKTDAKDLEEMVSGKYGGVGLVIRGINAPNGRSSKPESSSSPSLQEGVPTNDMTNEKLIEVGSENKINGDGAAADNPPVAVRDEGSAAPGVRKGTIDDKKPASKTKGEDVDSDELIEEAERQRIRQRNVEDGVRVVSAFEGYAYDAGLRVGDRLVAIDSAPILPGATVESVRNQLRGAPGTDVDITFERNGVSGPQTVKVKRTIVRISDVKYFGFVGDPADGMGYVDLAGFASDAGREVRFAIRALQRAAEMAAKEKQTGAMMAGTEIIGGKDFNGGLKGVDSTKLKGLILDLRGNPGGLLTSAVDVATLFVPNGSDIVSAKGRGFPEIKYRSTTDPILNPSTRLAVLINDQTASAAEIVAGAVQDLDMGIVVGKDRTFGKGLVQNVQDLPYQTALKYTVAKYYTPSGRCIQSTVYNKDGGGSSSGEGGAAAGESANNGRYRATKVASEDRAVFLTANGREVRDGSGIEVDYKIEPQKASQIEAILLNTGAYSDFAADWSEKNQLTDNFKVDEATYKDFQKFVSRMEKDGDIKLEVLYSKQLNDLKKKLKVSGFANSARELDKLRADIVKEVKKDYVTYRNEIVEDVEQTILSRYLPESMLIERSLKSDVQVINAVKMLKDGNKFDRILNVDGTTKKSGNDAGEKVAAAVASASAEKPGLTLQTNW